MQVDDFVFLGNDFFLKNVITEFKIIQSWNTWKWNIKILGIGR